MKDDVISGQSAIDAVADLYWMDERLLNFKKEIDATFDKIIALPSAQPEAIVYCGECVHMMPNGRCRQFADESIRPSASDYCSAGERRTDEV